MSVAMEHSLFPQVEYVVYRETYPGWHISARTIPNHELVLITEGAGEVTIEGRTHTVRKNDLIYFYPNQRHSLQVPAHPSMKFYGIHFSLLRTGCEKLPLEDICSLSDTAGIQALLGELANLWMRREYLVAWKQDLLLSEMLYTLFLTRHQQSLATDARISRVLDYIHQNPSRAHNIQSLCQVARMKKTAFIEGFRSQTGQTPIQYCLRLRLEISKAELLNTSQPICQIALDCGFQDEFYFSRLFRKHFGCPPSQFRRSR